MVHQVGLQNQSKKTQYILLTRRKTPKDFYLTLNKTTIAISATAKFLGLIFDKQLRWNHHITNIVSKSQQRINLLRSIAGQRWASNKTRTPSYIQSSQHKQNGVRSHYRLHSNRQQELERLERIQRQCLRIYCGALQTTPLSDMQQE